MSGMTGLRTLAIALTLFVSMPLAAQPRNAPADQTAAKTQAVEHAKERCKANRGVDCETPEGLNEWVLQERSREEAVSEGSRHLLPSQPRPAPVRR